MMVVAWIGIIVFVISGIAGAIVCLALAETKIGKVLGSIGCFVVAFAIASLIFWWIYYTESGERTQKNFESNTKGGLYRTVKVYDMEGDKLAEYSGKFDVQENADSGITKVKFDNDGKRHIIYCSTGTVIIDEVEKDEIK